MAALARTVNRRGDPSLIESGCAALAVRRDASTIIRSRRMDDFGYTWSAMNWAHSISTVVTSVLLFGCTSTESAIAPLGFGPLAKAELAEREHDGSRSQLKEKSKRLRLSQNTKPRPALASTTPQVSSTGGASNTLVAPASRQSSNNEAPAVSAPKEADWVGLWRGKDTTHFLLETFPSEPMIDDQARIRIEPASSQAITLVLIDSSNDRDLCSLSATLQANQAHIAAGQPCFGSEDETVNLSVHVKSGTAKLTNAALSVDISLEAEVKAEQVQASGMVEYHFDGKQ
jgi:hypothetical protein